MKTLIAQVALLFAERKVRENLRPLVKLLLALRGHSRLLGAVPRHHAASEGREYSWFTSGTPEQRALYASGKRAAR